jgi:hypothetical protein
MPAHMDLGPLGQNWESPKRMRLIAGYFNFPANSSGSLMAGRQVKSRQR